MDKVGVETAISSLEVWGRTVDNWVSICAAGVAIFLAAEVVFSVAHWLNEKNLRPLRALQSDFHAKELIELGKAANDAKERAAKAELALEKIKEPRHLSEIRQSRIVAILKPFAPQEYAVSLSPGVEANLVFEVTKVFADSGWIRGKPFGIVTTAGGEASVNILAGAFVAYAPSRASDMGALASKLAKALTDEGVATVAQAKPQIEERPNVIEIMLGSKPLE